MRRILPAVLLFSGVAMADGARKPPPIPAGARVAWNIVVTRPAGQKQDVFDLPQKGTLGVPAPAPWSCSTKPANANVGRDSGLEIASVECTTGEGVVRALASCFYSVKPKHPAIGARRWKPGDEAVLFLHSKTDDPGLDAWNIRLACMVDTRFAD